MKKLFSKMRCLKKSMNKYRHPKKTALVRSCPVSRLSSVNNQDGSVIIVALMALVIMTVIGLMSSDMVVTENFIIRNQGIYKQNVNMLEAAIMEGLQQFMQMPVDDPNLMDVNGSTTDFINNINSNWASTTWYVPDSSARVLAPATSLNITTPQSLEDRGEAGGGNLLVSFVGWEIVTLPGGGSESLVSGAAQQAVIKKGRILGEYISQDAGGANNGFGLLRMEIGVLRKVNSM